MFAKGSARTDYGYFPNHGGGHYVPGRTCVNRASQIAIGVMISYFVNCKYAVKFLTLPIVNFKFERVQMALGSISTQAADGVGIHIHAGVNIWRIPFGFQLVPAGIMVFGLWTVRVGPWTQTNLLVQVIYGLYSNRNHPVGLLLLADMKKRSRILHTCDEKVSILRVFCMRWRKSRLQLWKNKKLVVALV